MSYYHTTKDGTKIALYDISDDHLDNIIRYYEQQGRVARARVFKVEKERRKVRLTPRKPGTDLAEKFQAMMKIESKLRKAIAAAEQEDIDIDSFLHEY